MKRTLSLCLLLVSAAAADELSGPGRKTLVAEDWGTIFCQESCPVKVDSFQHHFRVTTDKGPMVLAKTREGWLLQAVNQNINVRQQASLNGNMHMLVQFNGQRYR